MSKSLRTKKLITIAVNLLLAVFEVIGVVLMNELYLSYGKEPWTWLWYYTQLSNIYSLFAAIAIVFVYSLFNGLYYDDSFFICIYSRD